MGTWRVEAEDGQRWVSAAGRSWEADAETGTELRAMSGPVPMGPGLGVYNPAGADDPVWLFFAALHTVPTPHTVSGDPPNPPARGDYPAGVVF